MIVTRWILGLFCGKKSASLQSLFCQMTFPKSPETYLLPSHPILTVHGKAKGLWG